MRRGWSQRRIARRRAVQGFTGVVFLGVAGGLVGCDNVQPVAPYEEPTTDPAQLYMGLTLNHPAVNLSTAAGYTTVQLVATPRDALGNPMSGLPAPTYSAPDTTKLQVSPAGLVTALGTGTGLRVLARLTVGSVTWTDTALINVKALPTPPVPASLSVHPIPPDTARWPMLETVLAYPFTGADAYFSRPSTVLTPRVSDTGGGAIDVAGLQIAYTSLDPAVAAIDRRSGTVELRGKPGPVRFVAQTLAYGVALADTVTYTITLPSAVSVVAQSGSNGQPTVQPGEVRINPSGYVGWFNALGDSVDVVFDDPTGVTAPATPFCDNLLNLFGILSPNFCSAGDMFIPAPMPGDIFGLPDDFMVAFTFQIRQFPFPGVYSYHSVRTGTSGRIIVEATP